MLDDTYDGDFRIKQFEQLFLKYNLPSQPRNHLPDFDASLLRANCVLEGRIFDYIEKNKPEYVFHLLPWCENIRYLERKYCYKIQFPLCNGYCTDATKVYELPLDTMYAFWFHKMYTSEPDVRGFEKALRYGGISTSNIEFPVIKSSIDDGQLKVTVDAVLSVDALKEKKNLKILVIGSAGKGSISGIAYDVISSMVESSVFYLYDEFTIDCSYEMDSNKFFHYAKKYERYDDVKRYDLVLDDSWVSYEYVTENAERCKVYGVNNFSIKRFPQEKGGCYNKYRQVFETRGDEFRAVSRVVNDYNYKFLDLGVCAACVELKYNMKTNICNKILFERFMRAHKTNCVTMESRSFESLDVISKDFVEIEKPFDKFIFMCHRLPWDSVMTGKVVPVNPLLLQSAMIKVSSNVVLTNFIVSNTKVIMKIEGGRYFFLGDNFEKFGLTRKKSVEVFVSTRVSSYHAFKGKERKRYLDDVRCGIRYFLFPYEGKSHPREKVVLNEQRNVEKKKFGLLVNEMVLLYGFKGFLSYNDLVLEGTLENCRSFLKVFVDAVSFQSYTFTPSTYDYDKFVNLEDYDKFD